MVTPHLFADYPDAERCATANQAEIEGIIRSTGFFRMKARNIIACSKAIVERHAGKVPRSMEELNALPGVGRKTANVVLGQAFGLSVGVVVDTHVQRLSRRMKFTDEESPEKIELDLVTLFPRAAWIDLGTVLILHGRNTCTARRPACSECIVARNCPSAGLV
jgi:endonuclease-3